MKQTRADRDLIDRIQIRQTETAIAQGYRVDPEALKQYADAKDRQMTQTTNQARVDALTQALADAQRAAGM